MTRAIVVALAIAGAGCYDGPTSDSSVFDCYCTQQIADMLNHALEISTATAEAMRADAEAFATSEINRTVEERLDPSFYWLDARVVELEARIRELEARPVCSSPDP